ncbi:MAG: GTP cyclohydrolase I [Candidatus Nanoarchaeia archaeon]|nr:GTP cyclohydrolase I [Candidatus Jingweiarchaeum tengchongense]
MDKKKVAEGIKLILEGIGVDLKNEHFVRTPERVADFYEEILSPKISEEDYVGFYEKSDLVIAKGIRVFSLCPHHLLPVIYEVNVAYIPKSKIVGVSKLVRVVANEASKLQVQERFTEEIASKLMELTSATDVMVVVKGEHYCMKMRGVKSDSKIITSAIRGGFKEYDLRMETLELMRG